MPNVFNETPLTVEAVPMIDAEGRHLSVVIGKVAFEIRSDGRLVLLREQPPIAYVDVPALGAPEPAVAYPSDLADRKPASDVLVAPPSAPQRWRALQGRTVAVRAGELHFRKRIARHWPLGPLARTAPPRVGYAGTYDARWVEQRMPLLPTDFDPRFHQAAPPDQIVRLAGDERIEVDGLYPTGALACRLPGRCMLVSGNVRSRYFTAVAALDTVVLDAESPRLTLVWRHAIVAPQKAADIANVFVHLPRLHAVRLLYGAP